MSNVSIRFPRPLWKNGKEFSEFAEAACGNRTKKVAPDRTM